LEYYEKALDIWERVLSPDHLNTAQSYNNIASVYCSQGNYAKALEYYGKVLDIRERVLGPDHLDTASSYNNIAGVYYSNGDYPNVLEYLRKTFDILERKLGSDHPNTKTVRENMEICRKLMQGWILAFARTESEIAGCNATAKIPTVTIPVFMNYSVNEPISIRFPSESTT